MDDIDLQFKEPALDYIVEKAIDYNLGARGLRSLCEEILNDAMFSMPGGASKKLVVTKSYAEKQLSRISLKKLKAWDEAQICLLTLQNNLLPLNNIHHSSSPLNREKVLNLTNDFVSALIESLNLQTHLKHNDCLLSTTRDQHTDNQNSIDNKHQITSAPINKVH